MEKKVLKGRARVWVTFHLVVRNISKIPLRVLKNDFLDIHNITNMTLMVIDEAFMGS